MDYVVLIARSIYKSFFLKKREEWKVVVICVAVATTIWFLQALNRNYTTHLFQPIRVEYDSTKLSAYGEVPTFIEISATGNGWNLIRRNLNIANIQPITIKVATNNSAYLFGEQMLPFLADNIKDVQLNFIVADTLKLNLEPIISRDIPLIFDTSPLKLDSCTFIHKTAIEPRFVNVRGGRSVINALPSQLTITLPDTAITTDVREIILVNYPQKLPIAVSPKQVNVSVWLKKKS